MNKLLLKAIWYVFGLSCVLIGLYPIIYFLIDRHFGLLSTKTQVLLSNQIWNFGFYGHIIFGGIALLVGWTQFIKTFRKKRIGLHRAIGKIYILSVMISGVCGVYIAQFATGGISNIIGFSLSGLIWLSTTYLAYKSIKSGKIEAHQNFMIFSYAVCFSAVTLRVWLPLLTVITGSFAAAYLIVGWLSWVPNLIVAYFLVNRNKT